MSNSKFDQLREEIYSLYSIHSTIDQSLDSVREKIRTIYVRSTQGKVYIDQIMRAQLWNNRDEIYLPNADVFHREFRDRVFALLSDPLFFEFILKDGFGHDSRQGEWDWRSPAMTLIRSALFANSLLEEKPQYENFPPQRPPQFNIFEKDWIASECKFDNQELIDGNSANLAWPTLGQEITPTYLGCHNYEYDPKSKQFHRFWKGHCKQKLLELQQAPNCSAVIFYHCNGRNSDPVFFIKDESGVMTALLSNDRSEPRMTQELCRELNIPMRHLKGIPLKHDGDCAVYTSVAINVILMQPNVYEILNKLRFGELSIADYFIDIKDLSEPSIKEDQPGPIELTRLFSRLARILYTHHLPTAGWEAFCEQHGIHTHYPVYKEAHPRKPVSERQKALAGGSFYKPKQTQPQLPVKPIPFTTVPQQEAPSSYLLDRKVSVRPIPFTTTPQEVPSPYPLYREADVSPMSFYEQYSLPLYAVGSWALLSIIGSVVGVGFLPLVGIYLVENFSPVIAGILASTVVTLLLSVIYKLSTWIMGYFNTNESQYNPTLFQPAAATAPQNGTVSSCQSDFGLK